MLKKVDTKYLKDVHDVIYNSNLSCGSHFSTEEMELIAWEYTLEVVERALNNPELTCIWYFVDWKVVGLCI